MKNSILKCILFLCAIILTSATLFAADYEEHADAYYAAETSVNPIDTETTDLPDIGKLQGNMEGSSGEGDSYYSLTFRTDGTLTVKKQFSGKNLIEEKTWNTNGTAIEIKSDGKSEIIDFDGKQLQKLENENYSIAVGNKTLTLRKYEKATSIFHLIAILLGLMFLNELFRRYKWVAFIFFGLVPLLMIPIWMDNGIEHWFRWVKLYSVAVFGVLVTAIRYTKLGKYKAVVFVAAALLAINIFEAVAQDFSLGFLPNILNAIAGILSIITLSKWKNIGPDQSKYKDMVWPAMTMFWIIAYDIWNFTFVYLNFPAHAAFHFMVLLACTLPILPKRGAWLQARVFTLGTWMMYLFTFEPFVDSHIVELPRNYNLMLFFGILSLVANLAYAIYHFRYVLTGKAPKDFRVGQDETEKVAVTEQVA
jgi:hypothetical protein